MLTACQPGYPKSLQEPLRKIGMHIGKTACCAAGLAGGERVHGLYKAAGHESGVCRVSVSSADCQSWEVLAC